MDDNTLNPETDINPAGITCVQCGSIEILEGYPTKLCAACRQNFINYPIPIWVKLFGAGISLAILISVFWFPKNLQAAIALSRAEKAVHERNYITAQRELEKARKVAPASVDILANLVIAGFYNQDFNTMGSAANDLEHKNIEDTALFRQTNYVINEFGSYVPTEAFDKVRDRFKNSTIPDTAYQHYIKKTPGDIHAIFSFATVCTNREQYQTTDSLLSDILTIQPSFIPAIQLKSVVKRELNQIDSSIIYCNRVLANNHQSVFGLSSKARTFLKQGKNIEGLMLAKRAYGLDKSDSYNLATLAIAYHFNKNFKQRDLLVSLAQRDSALNASMEYAKDIFSGKSKFQN